MIAALRVLWRALVHLYDESLLMIRANIVWFVGSLPLFLVVLVVTWLFTPATDPEAGPQVWPILLAGLVLLVVPTPFAFGIYALAAEIVGGETPDFAVFWSALRRWWKRGLVLFVIGGIVLGGLIFNAAFYLSVGQGWLQAVSILWVYAILFWITLQIYLIPLLLQSEAASAARGEPSGSLGSLYKRAAILAFANPILSLMLLLSAVLVLVVSAVAIPIYPLIAMAYVALVGARALHQLREKYFPTEQDEALE